MSICWTVDLSEVSLHILLYRRICFDMQSFLCPKPEEHFFVEIFVVIVEQGRSVWHGTKEEIGIPIHRCFNKSRHIYFEWGEREREREREKRGEERTMTEINLPEANSRDPNLSDISGREHTVHKSPEQRFYYVQCTHIECRQSTHDFHISTMILFKQNSINFRGKKKLFWHIKIN